MNNLLVRALLPFFLLSGLALAVPGGLDCLKVGKTPFTANPNLESDGMPVGGEQVGETEWYDKDFASTETMGEGDTILIENKGGNISGPNGNVVNGGLDGDCIELWYKMFMRWEVTITTTFEPGAIGKSESHKEYRSGWFYFNHGDLCPC